MIELRDREQLLALLERERHVRNLTETALSVAITGTRTLFSELRRGSHLPNWQRIQQIAEFCGLQFYVGPPKDAANAPDIDALAADKRLLEERIAALQAIDADIGVILDRLRARLSALDPAPPGPTPPDDEKR